MTNRAEGPERLTPLPLRLRHGLVVETLPLHHRDPVDRLLIAQAQCEDLTLVTADRAFAAYDVRRIEASSALTGK